MTSFWRRRAAGLIGRLGYDIVGLAPGAVMIARRPRPRVRRLAPGTVLLTERRRGRAGWMEVEKALGAHLAGRHVAGVLEMYGVNCVLDVGANRGQFGGRLRRYGYRGHIVSFEPVPQAFAGLEGKAARDPRWTAHRIAIGDREGTTTMRVVRGTMSSVLEPTPFGRDRYAQLQEPETVEVRRGRLDGLLDEVLARVPDPRPFLKLSARRCDLRPRAGLGHRVRDVV